MGQGGAGCGHCSCGTPRPCPRWSGSPGGPVWGCLSSMPHGQVCPSHSSGCPLSTCSQGGCSPTFVPKDTLLLGVDISGEKGSVLPVKQTHGCLGPPAPSPLGDGGLDGLALPGVTRHVPVCAASPPRCAILECSHVCSIDYTVVLGLRELLEDFQRQGVTLAFVSLQVGVPAGACHSQTSP